MLWGSSSWHKWTDCQEGRKKAPACSTSPIPSHVSHPKPGARCVGETSVLCLVFSRIQLCDPMDCSSPVSSAMGILQARILEWVVMPSSRGSSQARDGTHVSCIAGRFFTVWATREAQEKPLNDSSPSILLVDPEWDPESKNCLSWTPGSQIMSKTKCLL